MKSKIPESDLNRLRAYISSVRWQYAKTMPQWPHWYTIRGWKPEKQEEFDYFAGLIQRIGYIDPWQENQWHYLVVDEFKYWVIEDVLNRAAPKSNAQVVADGERYLKSRKE